MAFVAYNTAVEGDLHCIFAAVQRLEPVQGDHSNSVADRPLQESCTAHIEHTGNLVLHKRNPETVCSVHSNL